MKVPGTQSEAAIPPARSITSFSEEANLRQLQSRLGDRFAMSPIAGGNGNREFLLGAQHG
jgi:hypothetical protein